MEPPYRRRQDRTGECEYERPLGQRPNCSRDEPRGVGDLWSDDGDYRTVTELTAAKTRKRRKTHRVTARNNTRTRRRQCELRRDAAQLTVLRELQSGVACHAPETKGNRRGDTDTGTHPCPACGCQCFFLKESDMCDGCNEDVHIVQVCEACIWHACARCAAFARKQEWSTALGIVCGSCER